MSRKFIQFVLFFSIVCGSLLGYPFIIGRAQTPATLSNLEVDLWPEYDRPGVLVIYRITLPSGVSLPTDLTLRIPAAAGEPNAIASKQPDGSLLNAAYDRVVNGEWADITLTATMPEIQVEYYDPGITRDGNKRTFAYRWLGDYNVQSFQVQVQQPKDATNLSTSPALGAGVTRDDGLVYYTSNIGQLPAGQAFDITVNYDKASDDLTAANMQVQPSAPVADTAMGWRSQIQAALPWGLLVLGIVLLVGGGVWYWQSGKRKEQSKSPRRRRRSTTATSEPTPAGGQAIYCHSCGKRAGPNDRFCRTCGTKLRLE